MRHEDTGYALRLIVGGAAFLYFGPAALLILGITVFLHLLAVLWIVHEAKNPHDAVTTVELDDVSRLYPYALRGVHYFIVGLVLYYREGRAADRAVRAYDGARETIGAPAA